MKNDIIRIGRYRQRAYPSEYGVRIYQYETPTNYRQIVKIK